MNSRGDRKNTKLVNQLAAMADREEEDKFDNVLMTGRQLPPTSRGAAQPAPAPSQQGEKEELEVATELQKTTEAEEPEVIPTVTSQVEEEPKNQDKQDTVPQEGVHASQNEDGGNSGNSPAAGARRNKKEITGEDLAKFKDKVFKPVAKSEKIHFSNSIGKKAKKILEDTAYGFSLDQVEVLTNIILTWGAANHEYIDAAFLKKREE